MAKRASPAKGDGGKRIFVVDDDAVFIDLISRQLTALGHELAGTAVTGRDLLVRLWAVKPDLVLLDLIMSDGLDSLELCRALQDEMHIPVVMVTAFRDHAALAKAVAARPHGLLFKPLDRSQLAVAVESALRRGAEAALAASQSRMEALFEQASVGIVQADLDGRFKRINVAFAELMGYSAAELAGRRFSEFTHPEDLPEDLLQLERLKNGQIKTYVRDKRYVRPDGRVIQGRANVSLIRDARGRAAGFMAVVEDMGPTLDFKRRLEEQAAFIRVLFDLAPAALFYKDAEGVFRECNRAYEAFLGISRQDLLGKTVSDIAPPELAAIYKVKDDELLNRGGVQIYESRVLDAEGAFRDVVFHKAVNRDEDGRPLGILGIITDVTDFRRAERERRENELILRRILEGMRAAIVIIDPRDRTIVEVNQAAADIIGLPGSELVGHSTGVLAFADAAGQPVNQMASILDSDGANREFRLIRPDGRVVPVARTVVSGYHRGRMLLYEIFFDLTERKALERQLAVARKLESIGELAAGIAHEINTPTQYIGDNLRFLEQGFADLMACSDRLAAFVETARASGLNAAEADEIAKVVKEFDLPFLRQEIPKAIEQSLEGVGRVTSIVTAMRRFSHPGGEEKTAVDLAQVIDNTLIVARNEWKYVARAESRIEPDLPPVRGLAGDIGQVILNLLLNAAQAIAEKVAGTGDKGRIDIVAERDGDFARLTVRDTGPGIPEEHLDKIFDPFFTTKEVGKGTGQGLAIAHHIVVEKHGGTIEVDTGPGRGAAFVIRLPLFVAVPEENGS